MTSGVEQGALARRGLLAPDAIDAAEAILARVRETDIETVRVLFPDQHGVLRGKTVTADAFPSVFDTGLAVPSTLLLKDTSHRTVFPVWTQDAGIPSGPMEGANDILLVPDPSTFRPLPWSPHSAWILCDAHFRDGAPIPFASRMVLRNAVARLGARGMRAVFGLEVEFHVFRVTDAALAHTQTTMPGQPPQTQALTHGYQFLTDARYAEAEPVLDALRRAAQGLGLPVRSVEIEMGPSQFEFTFDAGSPMAQADAMVMFRTMVKEVCAQQGLHGSFMAKPRLPNIAANGWHIHQSVCDMETGRNLFMPDRDDELTAQAAGWLAGLLAHAGPSSLLSVPTINGYKRYQPHQLAPTRVQWGRDNRGAMVRALLNAGDSASRLENRAPETAANPHFALAAQIIAGLDGVTSDLVPPEPSHRPYDGDAPRLPASLGEALDAFEGSGFMRSALGEDVADYLLRIKRFEWDRYLAEISEWEQAEYFSLF